MGGDVYEVGSAHGAGYLWSSARGDGVVAVLTKMWSGSWRGGWRKSGVEVGEFDSWAMSLYTVDWKWVKGAALQEQGMPAFQATLPGLSPFS